MRTPLLFTLLFASYTVFGQGLGPTQTVHDEPSYGFARPVCGLNASGKVVVMWGKRNNQHVYVSVEGASGFGTPERLNPLGMTVFAQDWVGPDMAISGDNVHVTFKSQPEKEGFVYICSSSDGGKTFGDTVRVSDNNWSRFPAIAASPDGKKVYIAYMAFEPDFLEPHYVVCTSVDGGKTFGDEVKASIAPGEVCDCCPADIFTTEDQVIVEFRNNDDDLRDMWAAISTDDGKSFKTVKDIDETDWVIGGCPSSGPTGIIGNDTLYSVWMSGAEGPARIYLGTASKDSLEMGLNMMLTPSATTSTTQNFPIIAGSGNQLGIVWQENVSGKGSIKFVYSKNGSSGVKSFNVIQVDDDGTGIPQNPYMSYDKSNNKFHVVWQNNQNHSVRYRSISASLLSVPTQTESNNFTLFPNPSWASFEIAGCDGCNVIIRTIDGSVVKEIGTYLANQEIDISNLHPGIYLVEVDNAGSKSINKIIIAR